MSVHFAGKQTHFFHIVTESPWPLTGSIGALSLTLGLIMEWHNFDHFYGIPLWFLGAYILMLTCMSWWGDVVLESTVLGITHQELLTV